MPKIENLEMIEAFLRDAIEVIGWEKEAEKNSDGLLPKGERITPAQARMARANLKKICMEVGAAAEVSGPSISRYETNYPATDELVSRIRAAYEKMGIVFYSNGATG
jgi:hypothetical protein